MELGGAGLPLIDADGLELHVHKLYAVRNTNNLVAFLRLGSQFPSGIVLGEITDPGLDIPTTATVAAGRLWQSTPGAVRGLRLIRSTGSLNCPAVHKRSSVARNRRCNLI